MIQYYQPYLWPFLGKKRHFPQKDIKQYYYHSFEDGLWDFLKQKQVKKGSVFLVPDFYCIDVVENIRTHGFQVEFYSLDEQLQPNTEQFWDILKKVKPQLLIIFHAAGITSNLLQPEIFNQLPKDCYIIEDSVHRLVNPGKVKVINNQHFVMDSLRKVSPLFGSFLYGSLNGLEFTQAKLEFSRYFILTTVYFVLFKVGLIFSSIMNSTRVMKHTHERLLKLHDDVIGDRFKPQKGIFGAAWLHSWLDFDKVERLKQYQVQLYQRELHDLFESELFYEIRIPAGDEKLLHVYPLGICLSSENKRTEKLLSFLQKRGVVVWTKFPESPWSKNQQVLFLPLGFHILDQDIVTIRKTLTGFVHSGM